MLRRLRSVLRVLKSRRAFEQGMTDELRFHIEQYADDLVRSGVSPQEAARRARMECGGLPSVQEECREERGLHIFDELARELRYAARLLRKTPGFTATAVVTLAVCIGANLTIFAAIDAILLRPLPFPDSGRLVTIFNTYPQGWRRTRWFVDHQLLRTSRPDSRLRRSFPCTANTAPRS